MTFSFASNVPANGAWRLALAPDREGDINGTRGLYRSTNEGASWVRVNDDAHEFGGPANGRFVVGDMNVYGRVYMSTAGRGIVYGEPD